jgi:succinate dehydrogenase/fumarate reductase flavoprotein subunit
MTFETARGRTKAREIYTSDVLVVGGGLAGCWAALAAARNGASVILAEKGYVGTSGVTATAGPGHWWVPPEPGVRERAISERAAKGLGLADPDWMARMIDITWRSLPTLSKHYAFPANASGEIQYRGLRGPEYMRAMRAFVVEAGVTLLDQSPVTELLVLEDGAVGGARGEHRQKGEAWEVHSGAVIVSTGGCAFFSHLLGSGNNTGDGHLMAVEAGADLSGMEFSSYYTVAPVNSNMTRSMAYMFGRYFDERGRQLDIAPGPNMTDGLARALMKGKVFCSLSDVPEDIRAVMPNVQPNFIAPFDRRGQDAYGERFEVILRGEGTIRGIGGLRVINESCQTCVPGLFVAGDAASRELVAGAVSGGGAQNSAWALSSGQWAGQGAAAFARQAQKGRKLEPAGQIRSGHGDVEITSSEVVNIVRDEMETPSRNLFRSGVQLNNSRRRMDALWSQLQAQTADTPLWQAREKLATVAVARWCLSSAIERTETRGMHKRLDFGGLDPAQTHRLISRGFEHVTVVPDRVSAHKLVESV